MKADPETSDRKRERVSAVNKFKRREDTPDKCEICGWGLDPKLTSHRGCGVDVHHVVPVCVGGSDDYSNLIVLCPNHHSVVHALWLSDSRCAYWGGPRTRNELIRILRLVDENPTEFYESIQLTDKDLFDKDFP